MSTFVMRRKDALELTGNKCAAELLSLLVNWWQRFPRKLKVTQQQLANSLGYCRETVAKAMRILTDLGAVSWDLNDRDRQSRTRRYVVNEEKIATLLPSLVQPTEKARKPTQKAKQSTLNVEKPALNVEKSTLPINKELDPSIKNPLSDPPTPERVREDEEVRPRGGELRELPPSTEYPENSLDILPGENMQGDWDEPENKTPEEDLSSAALCDNTVLKATEVIEALEEEVQEIIMDKQERVTPRPIRVVDSRLGFGDGTNRSLEFQRQRARAACVPNYREELGLSEEKYASLTSQLIEWAMQQGMASPAAWAEKQLDRVRSGIAVPEWAEFQQGLPMGTLHKHEWQERRGIPVKEFFDFVATKLQSDVVSPERAIANAESILRNPKSAESMWRSFQNHQERRSQTMIVHGQRPVRQQAEASATQTREVSYSDEFLAQAEQMRALLRHSNPLKRMAAEAWVRNDNRVVAQKNAIGQIVNFEILEF